MTRKQVASRQILAAVIIVVAIAVVLVVHSYLTSFGYQVQIGHLTEATLSSSDGGLPPWKDPATLAEIRAALPRYKPGAGYVPYVHAHASIALVLQDDRNRRLTLDLPIDESPLVSIAPRPPRMPNGNCWPMPRLLAVLAKYGLPELEAKKMDAPVLKSQLQYWRDTFGGGQQGQA